MNNITTIPTVARQNVSALTAEQIAKNTPAVYERNTIATASNKYNHFNTDELLEVLKQRDWLVTSASQRIGKLPKQFAAHTVTCTHRSFLDKKAFDQDDSIPRIVIINSHNRLTPLTIACGVFRLVCSNGLIVKTKDFGEMKFKHCLRYDFDTIVNAVEKMGERMGNISSLIDEYKSIKLNDSQLKEYANEVYKLRVNPEISDESLARIDTTGLLTPRRADDRVENLWAAFNVAQENCIRGGIRFNVEKSRILREIKNPVRDWELNTNLWELTDNFRHNIVA